MGKKKMRNRCLIFGGGEILDYGAIKAQICGDDFIICADSGYRHCEKLGLTPDLLVGDFDSIGKAPDGIERICYPPQKNYTDSTLAVRTAAERGYAAILLLGMLGGRFDHSLANLQNLTWCAKNNIEARITDGINDVFVIHNSRLVLKNRKNVYFSVISLVAESFGVTITGAKYPLDDYTLTCDSPRAVSNEFVGNNVCVSVKNGIVAVVIAGQDYH